GSTATTTAHILNVAPVVNAGADRTVDEGSLLALSPSTFHDQGTLDTHTASIRSEERRVGEDGSVVESAANGTVAGSHVYADNGLYTVTVSVTDDDLATSSSTFRVTVNNLAPLVSAGADRTVDEGSLLALSPSSFHDQGTLDTHTASI